MMRHVYTTTSLEELIEEIGWADVRTIFTSQLDDELDEARKEGYDDGYEKGFEEGKDEGLEQGYKEGGGR